MKKTRREFLKSSAVAVAAVASPVVISRSVLAQNGNPGANDRVKVGIVGAGWRICDITNWPKEMYLQSVCDCDDKQVTMMVSDYQRRHPEISDELDKVVRYKRFRDMFDNEKLDGVFVTTPTHVRALIALHAMLSGFDVYAEKPFALTAYEGRLLVNAVRKLNRVFQVGTQARSIPINKWAVEQLHKGAIGKINRVEVANFLSPLDYKPLETALPAPEGMDWDMWCGPGPLYPCDPVRLLGGPQAGTLSYGRFHPEPRIEVPEGYTPPGSGTEAWGLYRDYDGGGSTWGMTGFGTHAFDQIQWAIEKDNDLPVEIWATETTHPQNRSPIIMKYADGVTIEMRTAEKGGPAFGGVFHGTEGRAEINRGQFRTNPAAIAEALPEELSGGEIGHVKNWLDCVRSRKDPVTTVEIGHHHSFLCHFGVIARDVKRKLTFDPKTEKFVGAGAEAANAHPSMIRPYRDGWELPNV